MCQPLASSVVAYISENDMAKYAFGDNLLGMTYKLHPYGTKQYILRENGMVNVNIAYESEGHVDFHYLTFQTNEAQQTALLTVELASGAK